MSIRGSVTFSALGEEMSLRAGFGAMDRFSASTRRAFVPSVRRLERIEVDPEGPWLLAELTHAMLEPRQPRDRIADIIDDVGVFAFLELLGEAVAAALPAAPAEGSERP